VANVAVDVDVEGLLMLLLLLLLLLLFLIGVSTTVYFTTTTGHLTNHHHHTSSLTSLSSPPFPNLYPNRRFFLTRPSHFSASSFEEKHEESIEKDAMNKNKRNRSVIL
jgi:hypothetical protein